ncbi:MAG: hypothetical protein JKY70_07720, partial [Mucilaginibacter sp.]|nr:hypothetical protein [Mucilaginibacter sp.]
IFSIFDAIIVLFIIGFSNKWALINFLTKGEDELLKKQNSFSKIGSLDSLKNVRSAVRIKKITVQNTFPSFATGTNAIRLMTTPVAACKLQPVFFYQYAFTKNDLQPQMAKNIQPDFTDY